MSPIDIWAALTGAKTVVEVAKGTVETLKGVIDVGRAGEDALSVSPEEKAARTAVAALYFEILYNLEAISQAQKSDPARLFGSRRVWERSDRILEHLSLLVEPGEIGAVISPFLQLDNFELVFVMPWINLLTMRLPARGPRLLRNAALCVSPAAPP